MYALFMWSRYYPGGGSRDLVDTYNSPNEAMVAASERKHDFDRYEVMDSSFTTIYSGACEDL